MLSQSAEYTIRPATIGDAGTIARHRATMFRDMDSVTDEQAEVLRVESEPWLAGLLASGGYAGWLCFQGSVIVAGAGILLQEIGPRPGCYRMGRAAHVVNVYTARDHRRRGIARKLMLTVLTWCREQGIDQVTLTASNAGRPLYETLGFKPASDMRLA
jgi:GNAT superfamily N-acetyltransferase